MPIKGKNTITKKTVRPKKMQMDEYLNNEATNIIANYTFAYNSRVNNCQQRVYVDQSSIHGRGLFANCDIKAGQILTYYPPHFVILKPNGYDYADGKNEKFVVPSYHSDGKVHNDDYLLVLDKNISICGDPDIIDNADFLAHMANDAMVVNSSSFGIKQSEIYDTVSNIKNNATLEVRDVSCIFIRAVKDIKKGDEITIPYGYNYWVRKNIVNEIV